jgi:predicted PhzF superfamily epimerase YddE/YHI9
MQGFARWTQLAETCFLLPPTAAAHAAGADYQVRIFTTAYEMPFAGHPTLGSCHAWLAHGGAAQQPHSIVQQCGAGLVHIRSNGQRLAFAAPALQRHTPVAALQGCVARALGLLPAQICATQHLHNGPHHFALLLDSIDSVLALRPDWVALGQALQTAGVSGVGVAALSSAASAEPAHPLITRSNREARAFGGESSTTPTPLAPEPNLEVRFFASGAVINEDPVTGSFNASLAQWLIAEGLTPNHYVAAQGCCVGADGLVHIAQDPQGQVWVGGDTLPCITGQVLL